MSDKLNVLEFNLADFNTDKYPSGCVIVIKDKIRELSIETGPGLNSVVLNYSETNGGRFQEYQRLEMSVKELANLIGFQKVAKAKTEIPRRKAS